MKTNQLAYIITNSGSISGVVNSRSFAVQKDFPNYAVLVEAIKAKDYEAIESLIQVAKSVANFTKGVCEVKDNTIFYNGKAVKSGLADRIIRLLREGYPFEPMLRFMENLLQNPSQTAIDELYLFLEASELPITEDGYFLAYKRVDKNFKSMHTSPYGTHYDHTIGAKPEMKREDVDPDRYRTCSRGLHFCALSYLPNYGSDGNGDKTVILKIHPADVVTIPSDYSNAKGRAWKYEVIAEHTKGQVTEAFDVPVTSSDGGIYGLKPSGQRYYKIRDAKGHFVKRT